MDEQSLGILEKLGRVLTTSIHPYIVAGDFQVSPGTMATIDFTQAVGATLVTASDGLGSRRGSRGGGVSTIDYFLVEQCLAGAISQTQTCLEVSFNPHRPVQMTFHLRAAALKALCFLKPDRLPTELPVGPSPRQQDWSRAMQKARFAPHAAEHAPVLQAKGCLDRAYGAWAHTAEKELMHLTGCMDIKRGKRGSTPKLQLRSVVINRSLLADPTNRLAKAFKWVAGHLEELLQRQQGSEAFVQVMDTFKSNPPLCRGGEGG